MLSRLFIQNYALIKKLEVAFDPGMNIITGETGAGKSIILGAMALMKGERVDTKVLLNTDERCIIEASFQVQALELEGLFVENDLPYENECIIRREIAPNGRSRAFVNDTPVTLDVLSVISGNLLDIHSQHDTLLLENSIYQLDVIDIFAGSLPLRKEYAVAFQQYLAAKKELDQLELLNSSNLKSNDYDSFLLNELHEAKLEDNEEEQLKADLNKIEHAEEIKLKLTTAVQQLDDPQYGVITNLKSVVASLDKVSNYDSEIRELKNRISSCYEEIRDVISEVETKAEGVFLDEEQAQVIRQRLDMIYGLQSKHRVSSVGELMRIIADLEHKLSAFSNLEERIETLKVEVKALYDKMNDVALRLSQSRLSKTAELSHRIEELLKNISINNAEVVVEHTQVSHQKNGIDQFDILFSANKGVKPQRLKNVASGGEFSRLMLCIKYIIADKKALPTIIFDEIDTGVSGDVALKMAQMMKVMSLKHQVITITHLPQIASFGRKHLFVYKDETESLTTSKIKELHQEERVLHVAEMIGGKNPSAMAMASAKELLDNYSA